MIRYSIIIIATALCISCGNPTPQGGNVQYGAPEAPKKVGLVLGGGGAKGAATIGALKVIEQSGIKIDYVAGTSIGAIIGALYCAGYSADEMATLFESLQWQDLLQGNVMEEKFRQLLAERGVVKFSDLHTPFRCVAVDVDSAVDVPLYDGDVYKAIRASMSIPPLYKAVELNGNKYLDGGFLNNLPVDVVVDMGADVVIAIDLQQSKEDTLFQNLSAIISGMKNADRIGGIIGSVLGREYEFAFHYLKNRPDTIKYVQNRRKADICINPMLKGFNTTSFDGIKCRQMDSIGESAAKPFSAKIKKIAISQISFDSNNTHTYNPL